MGSSVKARAAINRLERDGDEVLPLQLNAKTRAASPTSERAAQTTRARWQLIHRARRQHRCE